MTKETISARVSGKTYTGVEEFAEERDISKSEATNRLLDKALDAEEEGGMLPFTDGGTEVKQTLDQTQQQTEELQTQIESSSTNQQLQILALGLAVVWVMAYYESMISGGPIIVTGIGVIVANFVPLYREWSK